MWLQHLLVIFLIIVTPLWDRFEIPRLKASSDPRKKVRFYRKVVIASWICALVAILTIGIASTFTIHKLPGEIAWLDAGSPGSVVLQGVTAGMLIVILVPAIIALWSEKLRTKSARAARKLAFLLPSTTAERRWWWVVCLTAGICEEVVYRGFLLHYWHTMPFHLTLTRTLIVSSVIFGIAHLYQGIAGSVQTMLIGFVLGAIFLLTGSLWLPIVIHAVLDLRVLAMLPEGFENAPMENPA
jgi:uncharacterized protein